MCLVRAVDGAPLVRPVPPARRGVGRVETADEGEQERLRGSTESKAEDEIARVGRQKTKLDTQIARMNENSPICANPTAMISAVSSE